MTQSILDVVSKYIKRPHIAEEVPETAMQKHERDERKQLVKSRKIGTDLGNRIAGRHQAVYVEKTILSGAERQLEKENNDIDGDDGVVDDRVVFCANGVTYGNHNTPYASASLILSRFV